MELLINLILEKLLSERERAMRIEKQLSEHRYTLSQVANLLDADFNNLESDTASYVKGHEKLRSDLARVTEEQQSINVPSISASVARSLDIVGVKSSGSLATDLENLVRFLETSRFQSTKIL